MSAPQLLIDLAHPWATLYGDSQPVSVTVTYLHFGGLLLAGGSAVAVDRDTLRADRHNIVARERALDAIHAVHRWVLVGLALTFVSGVLLFASDVETYWGAAVFWVKMALVVLLLANGAWLRATERRTTPEDTRRWARLRLSAGTSLVLWCAILLFSILVTTAA